MGLRAVVIGTGEAGEGHTIALRKSGVEVVAMCGRTPEPARAMATKLEIEDVRFDWQQALNEIRPDIVSLATPGRPHQEMAETAASLDCHIFCDKPLALSASSARSMLRTVKKAGIKHAYGTSSRYTPAMRHAMALISDLDSTRKCNFWFKVCFRYRDTTLHKVIESVVPYGGDD